MKADVEKLLDGAMKEAGFEPVPVGVDLCKGKRVKKTSSTQKKYARDRKAAKKRK